MIFATRFRLSYNILFTKVNEQKVKTLYLQHV